MMSLTDRKFPLKLRRAETFRHFWTRSARPPLLFRTRQMQRSLNLLCQPRPQTFRIRDQRGNDSSAEYHPYLRHQVPLAVKQGTRRHPEAPVLTRMEMVGALDVVLAHDSVEEQEDVGTHSMYSGQASSA